MSMRLLLLLLLCIISFSVFGQDNVVQLPVNAGGDMMAEGTTVLQDLVNWVLGVLLLVGLLVAASTFSFMAFGKGDNPAVAMIAKVGGGIFAILFVVWFVIYMYGVVMGQVSAVPFGQTATVPVSHIANTSNYSVSSASLV